MEYSSEMMDSIRKVEATRPARIAQAEAGQHYPRLDRDEIDGILRAFHPDYKDGTKREISAGSAAGANAAGGNAAGGNAAGTVVPNELADLLEAPPRVAPADVDLDRIDAEADVLVIGGGGAGCAAALSAAEAGASVLIVTKLRLGDANTVMAEGGIQAADKENDSPGLHFLDVMGGGHFTNDREMVRALVTDAPGVIQWLEDLGLMFDKEPDGTMRTLHGGGTCRQRMHSAGDMTGAEIMRTLRDEVGNRPDSIRVMEFSPAVELILDGRGRAAGAVLLDLETEQVLVAKAKAVIIATGGCGRLHIQGFPTTNHYGATADGIVMACRAGAGLRFLDATQFHPTGVVFPEQNVGLLITEKIRGAGAQVVNIDGEQFVYPLETRDVESSAIIRECEDRGKGVATPTGRKGCWLDSPMIDILRGEGTIKRDFPAKYKQFMRHDIDISRLPVLIYPTLHYQNGGVAVNPDAESEIEGLYVAGEASGGVHGRNRLMGNSLLDILVFGRRAGVNAAARGKKAKAPKKLSLDHVRAYVEELDGATAPTAPSAPRASDGLTSPMLLPDYRYSVG